MVCGNPTSLASSGPKPMRERVADYIATLQSTIVTRLEAYGSGQKFRRESWTRDEGGGGLSYTFPPSGDTSQSTGNSTFLSFPPAARPSSSHRASRATDHTNGADDHPIEKAGVNISTINGILPPAAVKQMSTAHAALKDIDRSLPFVAAGLSLIIHPHHPRVPGVHANYRYFEVLDVPLPQYHLHNTTASTPDDDNDNDSPDSEPTVLAWWFGVITDITPCYVNEPDFRHFHTVLKAACDVWSDSAHTFVSVYPPFKASCDNYLFISHRKEHRGIGGVRFDDMDSDAMCTLLRAQSPDATEQIVARLSMQEALFGLVTSLGDSFLPSFIDILERRMNEPLVPSERRWQLLRRGRTVEFNLVVDRGTKFGLAAPGLMVDNVLVGLPPEARWEYCSELGTEDQDTEEAEMVKVLKEPRSWVD